ncbi:MAG: hypothetical protein ACOZF2_09120 [Thermodesulfobacteriota bacterium]
MGVGQREEHNLLANRLQVLERIITEMESVLLLDQVRHNGKTSPFKGLAVIRHHYRLGLEPEAAVRL